MSIKSDKLGKRVQEIQQYVAGRVEQDHRFSKIAQKLEEIGSIVAQARAGFLIVSDDSASTQSLQTLLNGLPSVKESCQIRIQTVEQAEEVMAAAATEQSVAVAMPSLVPIQPAMPLAEGEPDLHEAGTVIRKLSDLLLADAMAANLPVQDPNSTFVGLRLDQKQADLQPPQPEPLGILILRSAAKQLLPAEQNTFQLFKGDKLILGRNLEDSRILIPEGCKSVSRHHAEIELIEGTGLDVEDHWQITDFSRNGVYINGQRIDKTRVLQSGDRITLGDVSLPETTAELIFKTPEDQENDTPAKELIAQVLDCDFLCLLLRVGESWGDTHQRLLQQARKDGVQQLLVIVNIPQLDPQLVPEAEAQAEKLNNFLVPRCPDIAVEVAAVTLASAPAGTQLSKPEAEMLKRQDKFGKAIDVIIKRKADDSVVQRLTAQVQVQLNHIDRLVNKQFDALKSKLRKTESLLGETGGEGIKDQIKKVLKRVNDEKDIVIKQIKAEITQSRQALLDEFMTTGMISKIKFFVEDLEAEVEDKTGYRYVRPQLGLHYGRLNPTRKGKGGSVHMAALQIFYAQLQGWANKEWKQVMTAYAGGGLEGLNQRCWEAVNFLPGLQLPESLFDAPHQVDLLKSLQNSVVAPAFESRYKQPGIVAYMMKNLKGQVISIAGTLLLVGGIFFSKGALKSIIVPVILPIIGVSVYIGYREDKKVKLEDNVEKLKTEISNYYQSLCKSLVDKILQDVTFVLDSEERRLRDSIETVGEFYTNHLADVERMQIQLRAQAEQLRVQSKVMEKDLVDLEKLKRL
jgi:pSer/pThr/pTyr-binding forkhead associated (FHA) protein